MRMRPTYQNWQTIHTSKYQLRLHQPLVIYHFKVVDADNTYFQTLEYSFSGLAQPQIQKSGKFEQF